MENCNGRLLGVKGPEAAGAVDVDPPGACHQSAFPLADEAPFACWPHILFESESEGDSFSRIRYSI